MSPNRLMTYGVYALGAFMVIVGLLFVGHGVPIVRMELGWTQIMGGSVAASAGCIVLVLGLLLHHLQAMRDTVERLILPLPAVTPQASAQPPAFALDGGVPVAEPRPVHPLAPAARRDWPFPEAEEVRPEPALTAALHPAEPSADEVREPAAPPRPEPGLVQSAPALLAEEEGASHPPAVTAPDAVADPLAETAATAPRTNFLSAFLARRATGSAPPAPSVEPQPLLPSLDDGGHISGSPPLLPSRRTSIDLSSGWNEEMTGRERSLLQDDPGPADIHAPDPIHVPDPEPQVEPAVFATQDEVPVDAPAPASDHHTPLDRPSDAALDPLQPVVVGRYNAGAASYVMYSNGMIEVETEQGTHQFASMQDLKAFIERRDAKVS